MSALAVAPQDPSTLYAAVQTEIFKSTDGGTNWRRTANAGLPHSHILHLNTDPQFSGTLYAIVNHQDHTGSFLFKSNDGGEGWRNASSGLPESSLRGD